MSAGVPLPKQIVVHGFLFNRGEKMSKSVGNVVSPADLVSSYGLDPVRYFFLRETPWGQDGNYSHEAIVARNDADLANDLGNLAQRSLSIVARNGAAVPDWRSATPSPADLEMLAAADGALALARGHMRTFQLQLYIGAAMDVVSAANRYFAAAEPWRLAKSDPARMALVLFTTLETLRIVAILLQPVMPASMAKLLDLLAVPLDRRRYEDVAGLEGRFDAAARLSPGAALPPPSAIFPRYVEK
jgi:methionyl-tRNA synthetase